MSTLFEERPAKSRRDLKSAMLEAARKAKISFSLKSCCVQDAHQGPQGRSSSLLFGETLHLQMNIA